MKRNETDTLLELVDEAFDRKSWHGTNLRGSIRGLEPDVAAWRPDPGRHNIWELIVHAAYWKYTVRRRIAGEARGSFPLKGSNFFARPQNGADRSALDDDIRLLVETHRSLREAIAGLGTRDLGDHVPASKITYRWLVRGVAAHDLYHAGQIQLLKRLCPLP
jgi:hypothetical protein